jgi:hypothetical protein
MCAVKEGGPLPTKMADVVREALDDDGHRSYRSRLTGIKCVLSIIWILWCVSVFGFMFKRNKTVPQGTIGTANAGSNTARPLDGI